MGKETRLELIMVDSLAILVNLERASTDFPLT
jgi:hypothetical protein